MKSSLMALLLFLLLCPAICAAAPVVYPVKEVIGFQSASLAAKAPALAAWLQEVSVPGLSAEFVAAFKKEFGGIAVDNIDGKSRHRTLVASLQLVRASQYVVPKPISHCKEYQLPLTLSLVFTNLNTGEVLYSFTETSYAPVEVSDDETGPTSDAQLKSATAANYRSLLGSLLHKARLGYNPAEIQAAVAKRWEGLLILNKGSKSGIASNDELVDAAGNILQVCYVAEDYAVATPLLANTIEKGQIFSKFADQSVSNTVKKPKVLSMHHGWGDEQLEAMARYFDSELSKESAFTLLPVNESLAAVLAAVARDSNAGQFGTTNQRVLPNYLIKFSYAAPRVYHIGQSGKFGFDVYEQYVLGELLDKQGRIIYSAVSGDKLQDKNVEGMVLGRDARLEILLKNAVVELAEKFSKSIRFSHATLAVSGIQSGSVTFKDPAKQLQPGSQVLIFRSIGKVDGIDAEQVVVPIWQARVAAADSGEVTAELLMPLVNELKEMKVNDDDVVIVDAISAGTARNSTTSITYCKAMSSQTGALGLEDFTVLSHGFGHLLPYALYDDDPDFRQKIRDSVKAGGFRDTLKFGAVDTAGRCILPVHQASLSKRQCENEECEGEVQFATGYRLYVGKEKKGGAGSQTKISVRQVREDCFDPVLQGEISKAALGLLEQSAARVRYK
ncbi:MAG TPA: hypothetical protein VJ550_03830 [Geomonas sp.]|nr:hypothetical protein [Geomonas sp.]